jgi:hypothetical protein
MPAQPVPSPYWGAGILTPICHNLSPSRSVFLSSPLMGEDTGEGEQGGSSTGPLSLALSHEGRGDLQASSSAKSRVGELKLGPMSRPPAPHPGFPLSRE